MHASTLLDITRRSGGIVRHGALLRAGARVSDIRRAVRDGTLVRVRNGVLRAPDTPALVSEAAAHGGAVACVSALRMLGVWVWDDAGLTHVWLGTSGRRHEHEGCHCVLHHDGGTATFGVVPLVRALVQTASCLGPEAFFAAFESAWRRGLLDRRRRLQVRRGLRAGMRWLVDLARPDADSGLESILRLRLHRLGITLESQVRIPLVGIVDFVLDRTIILEVDGRENHDGASLRHKDLRRDALAAAQGYETLRFDYALVLHEWPVVERAILARRAAVRRRSA